jgi:hypothetical protein
MNLNATRKALAGGRRWARVAVIAGVGIPAAVAVSPLTAANHNANRPHISRIPISDRPTTVGPNLGTKLPPITDLARTQALGLIASNATFRSLAGGGRWTISDVGPLTAGVDESTHTFRVIGVVARIQLVEPVSVSRLLVPDYVPPWPAGSPKYDADSDYVPVLMSLTAKDLREVLVQVDLNKRNVIAIQPGPYSDATETLAPGQDTADLPPRPLEGD